jgi:catechol 2,3-dioxygenase-like lactoylglutathione lyase family enzyme
MQAQRVVPILNVSDVAASVAWFAKLGWTRSFQWSASADDPHAEPDFGGVVSGDSEIFLCRDGQGSRGPGSGPTGGPDGDQTADKGTWASIWVDDVDAVHERCLAEGIEVTHPPTDEPWNVREMHVRHPDGHVFRISRAI